MELRRSTQEEVNAVFTKNHYTLEDRFVLDSWIYRPLESDLKNLSFTELEEVRRIELKNLKNLMYSVFNLYKENSPERDLILDNPRINSILFEPGSNESEEFRKVMVLNFLLCGGDVDKYTRQVFRFEGKVPQKFGAFRQSSAQEWWNGYVNHVLKFIYNIDTKMGSEGVIAWMNANIAYMLNKEQPSKYSPGPNDNMNDAIARIIDKYLTEMERL